MDLPFIRWTINLWQDAAEDMQQTLRLLAWLQLDYVLVGSCDGTNIVPTP